MRKGHSFLILSLIFLSLFGFGTSSFAQSSSVSVDCSSDTSGNTYCTSFSPNATTDSAVLAGTGKINKVKLRNIENAPVIIQNQTNTDTMVLYGEIDNRGRPQDLTLDVQAKYDIKSAPGWMTKAPNAGSSLIVADSIKDLNLSVNGYAGKNGRGLSKLCGDRAMTALLASTVQSCTARKAAGFETGYFSNPTCSQAIIEANAQIASKVSANNGLCSNADVLKALNEKAPSNFCPADHFYLKDRDGNSPPLLKVSGGAGELEDFSDESAEGPVRLRFLNKCVKNQVFRECTVSGTVSISAPLVSYAASSGTQIIAGVLNQPLTITPILSSPDGAPVTDCRIKPGSPNAVLFPSSLSVHPKTCVVTGTPIQLMNTVTFTVTATNLAGESPSATFTMRVISPTIENNTPVNYSASEESSQTAAVSQVTYNEAYPDVTSSCVDKFNDLKSRGIMPDKQQCNLDQPGPPDCLRVLETRTQIRDVANYYGIPSLTYSNPTLTFLQGQVLTGATAIRPTSLVSANSGTPITGCSAITDPDSGTVLPPGLTVDSSCVISGTLPNYEISMRSFAVVATDVSGNSSPARFMMSVMPQATFAKLSFPAATVIAVTGQLLSITPNLSLNEGSTAITACALRADSDNVDLWPSTLSIDPQTCTITGTPTDVMAPTFFTIQATNAQGKSNSARLSLGVSNSPPTPVFSTTQSAGSCPYAADGEVFEKYTQDHVLAPYTPDIRVSAAYEEQGCQYGYCPGVTDTYTFSENASVNFTVEAGESGSFGGRADVFAYDIASTVFTFANGTNGSNGAIDMQIPKTIKYCAKVIDARGLNGVGGDDAVTADKQPLVNFHKSNYSPMSANLPVIVPGTAFPQRTQNQAVGIFKKVDSSVRQFIINEFIEPRFQ